MYGSQNATLDVLESTLSQLTADEYRESILEYMAASDKSQRIDPVMIDQQPEISWKLWPFLVDAMVDMHTKLGLEPQTLSLAVNIVNRYCARRIVYQKHFHLVGFTAMWIASKYEDKKSAVPTLRMLRHMANNCYPEEMFVMMEGHILNTLEWTVSHCNVDSFLRVMLSENGTSPLLMSLTSYIAEITFYHKEFVGQDTLMIARAIHYLSLHLLNVTPIVKPTEADQQWRQWVPTLAEIIVTPPRAILEKYRSPERHAVTWVVDGWLLHRQRHEAVARAKEEAVAAQQIRVNGPLRQSSSDSLPMTPPHSASRTTPPAKDRSNSFDANFNSPNSAFSDSGDPFMDSPLTNDSLASLTSLSSISSLSSVKSVVPHQLSTLMAQSPPVTPLNPPKPFFRV